MDQLYIVEKQGDESRMEFETRIRDEYAAKADEDKISAEIDPADIISAPFETIPDGCTDGQTKLDALNTRLDDIQELRDFIADLQPRIDDAAVIFLMCTQAKQDLTDLIANEFS